MDWLLRLIGCAAVGLFGACRPAGPGGPGPGGGAAFVRPDGPLGEEQAGRYVLELVNRDRSELGLEPVEWDEVAARAAKRHAQDMAHHGFTGHWGTDGSVPEQRYTEAGGDQMVQENAGCFFDGVVRELAEDPRIFPAELEMIQAAFMDEVPPNDGHKKNILKPLHTHLGVGVAQPEGRKEVCMSQEFVDVHGEYEALPATARPGQVLEVRGEVHEPMEFGGVGLARIPLPKPVSFEELSQRGTYPVPEPDVLYFPKGYKTPKPVHVENNRFSIEIEVGSAGKGLYEVSIWGRPAGEEALIPISIRTVLVR